MKVDLISISHFLLLDDLLLGIYNGVSIKINTRIWSEPTKSEESQKNDIVTRHKKCQASLKRILNFDDFVKQECAKIDFRVTLI